MPQLQARGVDLVVDLFDAAEHFERLTPSETKALLLEAANMLGKMLKRDIPAGRHDEQGLSGSPDAGPGNLNRRHGRDRSGDSALGIFRSGALALADDS